MADERADLIADFIAPLRVEPGSKVRLERDFDPRYKGNLKKQDGGELLRTGVSLLAEYQERPAAQPDIRERRHWDDYQHAFSEMLSATSTRWAPWYVAPADRKWFARVCELEREAPAGALAGAPADPYAGPPGKETKKTKMETGTETETTDKKRG